MVAVKGLAWASLAQPEIELRVRVFAHDDISPVISYLMISHTLCV